MLLPSVRQPTGGDFTLDGVKIWGNLCGMVGDRARVRYTGRY